MVGPPKWGKGNSFICSFDGPITQVQRFVESGRALNKSPRISTGASGDIACSFWVDCNIVSEALSAFALGWIYTTMTKIWGNSRGR